MAYSTSSSPLVRLILNSDSSNYSRVFMFGDGSTTGSGSFTGTTNGAASVAGMLNTYQLMDYSATDKHKTILTRYGSAGEITLAQAARYASTSAVSSIQVSIDAEQFASGSTFSLYGVIA
jgi:hypothetical protein